MTGIQVRVAIGTLWLLYLSSSAAGVSEIVEELFSLSRASKDAVIRLNDDSYKRFATGSLPRTYSIFVFYDAVNLRDNPQLNLPGLRREFGALAQAVINNQDPLKTREPVFFADIEFTQSQQTFRNEGIQSLPYYVAFTPGDNAKGQIMDLNRHGRGWEATVQFLKKVTGSNAVDVPKPPLLSKTQMALIALAIIAVAPFIAHHFLTKKTVLHDSRLWCLGGLVIYLFSVSGGMFNIIRNMPMFVPSRDKPGEFVYFLQQSGNQFGAEGLAIGSFYTAFGLVGAFVVYVLPQFKSHMVRRVGGMISLVVCAVAVRKVLDFYVWKQGYWMHGFWPTSWR